MPDAQEGKRPDYTGLIIGLVLAPVYLLFILLGREELGRTAFLILAAMMLAIRINWHLRNQIWFWATVLVLLLFHVPMLFSFSWPRGWFPAIGMLPIVLADLLLILGVIGLVEKLIARASPPSEKNESTTNRS